VRACHDDRITSTWFAAGYAADGNVHDLNIGDGHTPSSLWKHSYAICYMDMLFGTERLLTIDGQRRSEDAISRDRFGYPAKLQNAELYQWKVEVMSVETQTSPGKYH
jgi:hypothetical protein